MTRRILFISPLDRRTVLNTREQNMVHACRQSGHTTLSLTLAQNTSRAAWDIVRDTVTWRAIRSDSGEVVTIDPPLNPCTGLHTNLAPSPHTRKTTLRARIVGFLAPLGVLRDVVIIPAFFLYALRCGRFDICIAYGPWAACVGWLLRCFGRTQVLVYDDQDYEPAIMRNPVRQRWAIFLERTMMQRADVIVSVGERLATLRRKQTGCPVTVIPNGVREVTPRTAERPIEPGRAYLTLVYVGNVVPWSGLDEVLNAVATVNAEKATVRMLIVGDGLPSYMDSLRQQVDTLNLGESVTFVGRVPNHSIGTWLAQADVGLALFRPEPLRQYAFPLKVVEYMQAGLAVLGTQDTETEDIVRHHDIGLVVPFSASAMADAMRTLLSDPVRLIRHQENALRGVTQYQWSALAARELSLAEQALAIGTQRSTAS